MYKFLNDNKTYDRFYYVETKTFQPTEIPELESIHPRDLKLFSNDIFDIVDHNKIKIVHSNIRSNKYNAGILDLTSTHGKHKNKFLYLCKPDDKRIPFFLIPFEIKPSFDKSVQKIYITFEFTNWNNTTLPTGRVTQNLGDNRVLHHFYEYILYCKSLNISIQSFTKDVVKRLKQNSDKNIISQIQQKYNLDTIHANDEFVFTIDPVNSVDFDDAISYNKDKNTINIYITNVAIVLDHLDLWKSFTNRICSIYLPDKKRSMLPSLLSECLCSLNENKYKLCYVMTLYFDEKDNSLLDHFDLAVKTVYISKNYTYHEENKLEKRKDYRRMIELMRCKSSKDLIGKLMLKFNQNIALQMGEKREGIYRCIYDVHHETKDKPTDFPSEIYDHIQYIRGQASSYSLFKEDLYNTSIYGKNGIYLQVTSPIRRLVDLLNNIALLHFMDLHSFKNDALIFYKDWISDEKLDFINTSSRAVRKIQSKCQIYHTYEINRARNQTIEYIGYLFDKIKKEGDGKYQYMVYLPDLNLTSYITLQNDLENYSKHIFSIYIFMSEENEKRKIKLQICFNS